MISNIMGGKEFRFASNPERTVRRVRDLKAYFTEHVLDTSGFKCASYNKCRRSHSEQFYEGQIHHIGRHYDLIRDETPFRIVIVGQEYGHKPALVSLDRRSSEISHLGRSESFSNRNPHMRETTSLLRLLLGMVLGESTNYARDFRSSVSRRAV
jgi:hypothetical protein